MRETSGARPFGPFVNQHHFATFMQMTGGLALALLFGKKAGREQKILLAAAIVVMAFAVILWIRSRMKRKIISKETGHGS